MIVSASPFYAGLEGKPAIGLWLIGGAAVIALHAVIAVGLDRLTPDVPPVERNPALTVELAPFTIPAVVEQDHQLLVGSDASGDVLAPVRQSQAAAEAAAERVQPVEAPRTVAQAIAAAALSAIPAPPKAAPTAPARPDTAAPVAQNEAAPERTPERMRPVDGPRDVAEAIAAAETDPVTAVEQDASALPRADAPPLAAESTGSIVSARPVTPPIAAPRSPDAVLSGVIVPEPAEPEMPAAAPPALPPPMEALDPADPAMPDIVAFLPAPRPEMDVAARRALAAANAASRAVAARAAGAKIAAAREARRKTARTATLAARTPAAQKPTADSPSPAPTTTPAERQVAAVRGTVADPAAWQRRVSAIVNGRKRCPAGIRITAVKVAQIRFPVDVSGRIGAARIARSSGNPALDRAALEAARRASPLPPPPGGRAVSVGVSLSFSGC